MAVRKIPISEYYYRKREIDAFLNTKSNNDHVHGNIGNDGKINSDTNSVNKIVVTDSSNTIKTIDTLPIGSITHQDISGKVNTSDIKDNLDSTDTNKPLSANQGKVLKGLVDSKSDNSHVHGSIENDGKINSDTNSVNKIVVTDSSNNAKTINILPLDKVTHQDISNKVNIDDIKDNLTSTDTNKPLSAKQGKELKTLVDTKANSDDVYSKSQTMSASDIRQAIADGVGNIDIFEIVSELPTSDIKGNKFYLTANNKNINRNIYDINIYVNNNWETIDSLEFDISNYPTTSEVNILLNGKVDKIDGKQLSKNDFTDALKSKLENDVLTEHQSLANYIQKSQTQGLVKNDGTIDTNQYLTEHQSLANYVQKSQTQGLIKNDGTIDSNQYLTQHQSLANYVQKSQTQGLVKNDGTIDTNEYVTKETVPKSFNYGFIDSNLVLHLMYLGTEISVTKTIMQIGDNNPITVVVSDEEGNLLEGIPVEFYINGVKVGQTTNTNSNGVASYTYQGIGSGEIEVQIKIGSIVSVPCNVLDCIFKDMGTSSDYGTWTSTDFTGNKISRNDEYTTLIPSDNWDTQNQTISDSNLCIEFDINITYTNAHYFIRFMGNGSNVQSVGETQLGLVSGEWSHVKFVRNGNQLNITVDDVEKTPQSLSASLDNFRFMLDNTVCTDMKYKNFKIYPI